MDPGNCFTSMALGLHLPESAAGRELHDRSVAFMCGSFGPVVAGPSFAAQRAEAVASLVDRDEVGAAEEEVFWLVKRFLQWSAARSRDDCALSSLSSPLSSCRREMSTSVFGMGCRACNVMYLASTSRGRPTKVFDTRYMYS